MSIIQDSQLYSITYKPTKQRYIGLTWGKNHSYLKRFKKHMNGKGGVYIKQLLINGASIDDFEVELLYEDKLEILYQKEIEMSELYPKGLNGNKGNAIIQSKNGQITANQKRLIRIDETRKKISKTLAPYLTDDEIQERMKHKDWWKSLSEDEKSHIKYERNKNISEKYLQNEKVYKKRQKTLSNLPDDVKFSINQKRSESIKKSRQNETEEQRTNRIKKQKLFYKKMSDEEFDIWKVGKVQWVIERAERQRYGRRDY